MSFWYDLFRVVGLKLEASDKEPKGNFFHSVSRERVTCKDTTHIYVKSKPKISINM